MFKSSLTEHWGKCYKQMKDCFSTRLILKPASNLKFVTVYLNPKNIDIDLGNRFETNRVAYNQHSFTIFNIKDLLTKVTWKDGKKLG